VSRPAEALGVVLDANVLYPQWLRDVMLTLAAMGYYDPAWSHQIIRYGCSRGARQNANQQSRSRR
jgi:hypothetical protein